MGGEVGSEGLTRCGDREVGIRIASVGSQHVVVIVYQEIRYLWSSGLSSSADDLIGVKMISRSFHRNPQKIANPDLHS
jgi:hypothetical protein